jgi:hypothetical protein
MIWKDCLKKIREKLRRLHLSLICQLDSENGYDSEYQKNITII